MAAPTFFFYDLETSGLDPKRHRIMQFAGQRTTMELEPVGEPVEFFVRLTPEVLPDPQAIQTTGITPQYTLEHGLPEREAIARIMNECFTADTIVVGFNNVRFDDEFIRYTAYRNFWNPYEWAYADGRSRWDLLDVVRLVRALRPDGINWPVDSTGAPINRLELITAANGVAHTKAHDAMSDVEALIEVARLIKQHQPKMFAYLLEMRSKQKLGELVDPRDPQPFVYASAMYGAIHNFTTAAAAIASGENGRAIIWDLRFSPDNYVELSVEELGRLAFSSREELEQHGDARLPVKELASNKCPAVAPWSTLRPEDATRLSIDKQEAESNLIKLLAGPLPTKLAELYRSRPAFEATTPYDVDGALYDGFIDSQSDKNLMTTIRHTPVEQLGALTPSFNDRRLGPLWWRYLARNTPESLPPHAKLEWESYVSARKSADLSAFQDKLEVIQDPAIRATLAEWAD